MNESQSQNVVSSQEVKLHRNTIDLRGQRFGKLTVKFLTNLKIGSQKKWSCACDCGEEVLANQTQLSQERITVCQTCVSRANEAVMERERGAASGKKIGGVKILPSERYLSECFDYNQASGALTWKRRPMEHFVTEMIWNMWLSHYEGNPVGKPAVKPDGTPHAILLKVSIGSVNLSYTAHRVIWALLGRTVPDGLQIDHEDGNPYNNALNNLRVATCGQNISNQDKRKSKRRLLKGTSLTPSGTYQAMIRENGRQKHLGMFKTEQAAHEAYCEAAKKVHGEFYREPTRRHGAATQTDCESVPEQAEEFPFLL